MHSIFKRIKLKRNPPPADPLCLLGWASAKRRGFSVFRPKREPRRAMDLRVGPDYDREARRDDVPF